jgi:transposase-like protein
MGSRTLSWLISKELRERAIARMLPPVNASISAVSCELNISYPTLNAWRAQTSKQAAPVQPDAESDDQFDSQSKFQDMLETVTLNVWISLPTAIPKVCM